MLCTVLPILALDASTEPYLRMAISSFFAGSLTRGFLFFVAGASSAASEAFFETGEVNLPLAVSRSIFLGGEFRSAPVASSGVEGIGDD